MILLVAASERGRGQTAFRSGVVGLLLELQNWHIVEQIGKSERRGWYSRIRNVSISKKLSWVRRSTWNFVGISRDHSVSLNTPILPIVNQYREGKVKRTPRGEWNSSWNHMPTRRWSPLRGDTVLFVERAGELLLYARLSRYMWSRSESEP